MWTITRKQIQDQQTLQYSIEENDTTLTYRSVLHHWRANGAFRDDFIDLLANAPFRAYRWETPPISIEQADRPFEFVLLNSPDLDRPQDDRPFSQYLNAQEPGDVISFENLARDAKLVVPVADSCADHCYSHIGCYSRTGPRQQQHALWQMVAELALQRLDHNPLWISTAGGGVAWLHVRLDSRPKYYSYRRYRSVE